MGSDLATQGFQVHGVDRHDTVVMRKPRTRANMRGCFAQRSPCVIGIEACASAHDWARDLSPFGHTVRLSASPFVRPYRKTSKNDGNGAEAICEAVARPTRRVVPVTLGAQQAVLTGPRARELVVGERTVLVHQSRGVLAEYGLVVSPGMARLRRVWPSVLDDAANGLPGLTRDGNAA